MNATIRLALAASLLAAGASHAQDGELSIAMLIPGKIDDNGFMEPAIMAF